MNLAQIGEEIRNKRVQLDLLQEQVANLAGLSRVTVNQLENGTLNDIGYNKLKAVMEILGLDMTTAKSSGVKNALTVAARSASTSYRDVLTPEMLKSMLRSGQAPARFQPHLMVLLDEAPVPVVVQAIAEAATPDVPAKKIMKNLNHWAKQWQVCRTIW
jgi:transcriptional regulator with XRE-family HTH domain